MGQEVGYPLQFDVKGEGNEKIHAHSSGPAGCLG